MSLPKEQKRKIFDGRYEILSIVGRGADSVVYHARHVTGTAQEVAIKVLINRGGSQGLTDKLRKEALTLVSCRHKYVVRLDDFHSIKDLCYLSMEYAPQGDLIKYIATTGNKLPVEQASLFLRQALEALDFIHATGVVHRDLKPENILVMSEKEIRIADFGLALLPGDEVALTELQNAVGTFDYLAPEVLSGVRYDTVSDLYSLGLCFYEAISGTHPFRDVPLAQQQEVRNEGRIRPLQELAPELPPHTAAVVSTLLRFSPEARFQSASEALRALADKNFQGEQAALENPTSQATSTTAASQEVAQPTPSPSTLSPTPISRPGASKEAAVATTLESSEGAHSQRMVQEPANSDVVAERASQPTERIDLERVKAIIAKDTQRRTTSGASSDISPRAPMSAPDKTTSSASVPALNTPHEGVPIAKKGLSVISDFRRLPRLTKSITVALGSAVLTISSLLLLHSFSPSKTASTPEVTAAPTSGSGTLTTTADQEQQTSNTLPTGYGLGLSLSEGIYTGSISGLLPSGDIPLALISRADTGGPVLILGMSGWLPTLGVDDENDTTGSSKVFRTNGLILKFNREMSADKITGTVTDVVTGDSGTWTVEKSS